MNLLKQIKYLYQRITRGFSDDQLWSVGTTFAIYLYPRLKRFKEININSYPTFLDNGYNEWQEILDKMIYAMKMIASQDHLSCSDEEEKAIQEGCELFGKYFRDLWD